MLLPLAIVGLFYADMRVQWAQGHWLLGQYCQLFNDE